MAFKFANEIIDEIKERELNLPNGSIFGEEFEEWLCTERKTIMIKEEVLRRVEGYLTDDFPPEDFDELEDIMKAGREESSVDCVRRKAVNELFDSEIKMYKERIEIRKGSTYYDETERIKEFRSRVANAEYWQDKINALPPVTSGQKWIPCSSGQLPKDFQRVLVTIVRYNGDKVVRVAEYSRRTFKIKENHEQWNVGEKGLLAWMPMIEPYEEKEN